MGYITTYCNLLHITLLLIDFFSLKYTYFLLKSDWIVFLLTGLGVRQYRVRLSDQFQLYIKLKSKSHLIQREHSRSVGSKRPPATHPNESVPSAGSTCGEIIRNMRHRISFSLSFLVIFLMRNKEKHCTDQSCESYQRFWFTKRRPSYMWFGTLKTNLV